MCTLIIARNIFRFYPLVIAANRDERRHRESESPAVRAGVPTVLSPTDALFGGTWIGVNERGVVAAITNREGVPHVQGRISRGTLARTALACTNAAEALARVIDLGGSNFNGFQLAILDGTDGYLALGDGKEIVARPIPDGLTIVTEKGWGDDHSPRASRITAVFRSEVRGRPPRPSSLSRLLALHERGFEEAGVSSTCLHGAPDDHWVTKSSAVIRQQDHRSENGALRRWWEFFHRERPEGRPNCEGAWMLHELDLA